MLTVAYLNTVCNAEEFCNGVNAVLSLYLNVRRLRTDPGKLFMGALESPGFFVSKRVGTLHIADFLMWHK